jgi:hypothetical protein
VESDSDGNEAEETESQMVPGKLLPFYSSILVATYLYFPLFWKYVESWEPVQQMLFQPRP